MGFTDRLHMFGGGGRKNGVSVHYYVCSKRFNHHECEQDYVRSDLLDAAIIEDVKGMFRDEQFMGRIWEEANKRLAAERPAIEKEIEANFAEAAKVQASMDRYFQAFEAGKLEPELCNEKVRELRARLEELEGQRVDLEARRERLELPAIDREMLSALVDQFEKVMAAGTNGQKKDLLHRVVKKVLIKDRHTVEVWYALPNRGAIESCNIWLPKCNSIRTGQGAVPEIYFRVLHIADDAHNGVPGKEFHEQAVEIALGPKGAFQASNLATLTRRVAPERTLIATPARRAKSTSPRVPRTPRVVELLRRAIEWKTQLESQDIANQAAIAAREGITRARVAQVMGMLRLAPDIREQILAMPDAVLRPRITERALRPIIRIPVSAEQRRAFHLLLEQRC